MLFGEPIILAHFLSTASDVELHVQSNKDSLASGLSRKSPDKFSDNGVLKVLHSHPAPSSDCQAFDFQGYCSPEEGMHIGQVKMP